MVLLNDFTTSVRKALEEIDPDYESYPGVVVCGTHAPHEVEEMITRIKEVRETGEPFLGICFGHQLAAVEYARNVLGIQDAVSEEWGSGTPIVKKLPQLNVGMRNGESYWNNYAVDESFEDTWVKPDNFITTQFHPEYQSSAERPHPVLVKFINLCKRSSAE